jgi:DNA primase
MSIFTDRSGTQRWSCWATGRSGTAIDLVATALRVDVGAAIEWLADRHQLPAVRPRPAAPPAPRPRVEPSRALRDYVGACARRLWEPEADEARTWLTAHRRLSRDVLAANQVGFDPSGTWRPSGLPFRGPGVVIPTFGPAGDLVYAQVRYLDPARAGRKYDNPSAAHATKPVLSWPRPSAVLATTSPVVVCEGTLDAMTVTAAGVRAVALIAAGDARQAPPAVAAIVGPIVLAVDNDAAGRHAADLLLDRLRQEGRHDVARIVVPGDVNEWAQRTGDRFPAVLRAALRGAHAPRRPTSTPCR